MNENETLTTEVLHLESDVFADATKINLSVILEECMGQLDLLEELIMLYKQNALEFMGVLSAHLPNGDMKLVGAAAHKIKSGLAMMQSESLHSIVVQIEKALRTNKDQRHVAFLFECFVKEYPLVEIAIDEQVKALKNG